MQMTGLDPSGHRAQIPVTLLERYSFVCSLFNDGISTLDYIVSNDEMIIDYKLREKKTLWLNSRSYPYICAEEMRKTMKAFRIVTVQAEIRNGHTLE
jgi:hypothetical protein